MDHDLMRDYLERCKELSLTARMAVALLVFEQFCAKNRLSGQLITEFSDYLWRWPLIDGPDEFGPWEAAKPELVGYGLGSPASDALTALLVLNDVEEDQFRTIVEGVVEILWGSFWGASENALSLQALSNVIRTGIVTAPPPLTPFLFSRFSDGQGWGRKPTPEDRDYWRCCTRRP